MVPPIRPLNATWFRGYRRPAWMDLDGVDQLFIMNCFVTRDGWAEIAGPLARLLKARRAGELRLYLSLEGATNVGRYQFYDELVESFGQHPEYVIGERPPLQVFFVRDEFGSLFHPKAYAVQRGERFVVSVGSANLTRAAQSSNHELPAHPRLPARSHESDRTDARGGPRREPRRAAPAARPRIDPDHRALPARGRWLDAGGDRSSRRASRGWYRSGIDPG